MKLINNCNALGLSDIYGTSFNLINSLKKINFDADEFQSKNIPVCLEKITFVQGDLDYNKGTYTEPKYTRTQTYGVIEDFILIDENDELAIKTITGIHFISENNKVKTKPGNLIIPSFKKLIIMNDYLATQKNIDEIKKYQALIKDIDFKFPDFFEAEAKRLAGSLLKMYIGEKVYDKLNEIQ